MCVRVFVTEFALPSFKSALKVARRDSLAASRKRRRVCLSVCVCVETAVVTHLFGTRWRRTRARDAASNPMCAKKSAFLIGRSATSARQQRRRSYSPHRSLDGVGVGGGGGLIFQPPTCDGLEICSRLPLSFFFFFPSVVGRFDAFGVVPTAAARERGQRAQRSRRFWNARLRGDLESRV